MRVGSKLVRMYIIREENKVGKTQNPILHSSIGTTKGGDLWSLWSGRKITRARSPSVDTFSLSLPFPHQPGITVTVRSIKVRDTQSLPLLLLERGGCPWLRFQGIRRRGRAEWTRYLSLSLLFSPLFPFRLREESESPCLGKHDGQSLKARLAAVLLPDRPLFLHY